MFGNSAIREVQRLEAEVRELRIYVHELEEKILDIEWDRDQYNKIMQRLRGGIRAMLTQVDTVGEIEDFTIKYLRDQMS